MDNLPVLLRIKLPYYSDVRVPPEHTAPKAIAPDRWPYNLDWSRCTECLQADVLPSFGFGGRYD